MTKTPVDNPKGITPETVREMHDYVIGYGQPPQVTRFQKGASGNPRGRPRKTSAQPKAIAVPNAIAQQAARIARRQLKVREGGKVRKMDSVEAILLQLQRKALTGNVPAMRLLQENVREGEWAGQQRLAQEAAATAEERAKIRAYWKAKLQESAQHYANAERMGLPPPAVYPHPDDIRFGEDDRVEILGPTNAKSAKIYDDLTARQVFWIAYVIYDQWLRDRWKATHPGCATNGWMSVPALLLFTDRAQPNAHAAFGRRHSRTSACRATTDGTRPLQPAPGAGGRMQLPSAAKGAAGANQRAARSSGVVRQQAITAVCVAGTDEHLLRAAE